MTHDPEDTNERTAFRDALDYANRALRREQAVHKALGVPWAVWRDGAVHWIAPEDLPDLRPEDRAILPESSAPPLLRERPRDSRVSRDHLARRETESQAETLPSHRDLLQRSSSDETQDLFAVFSAVADRWRLNADERCALMGDVARSSLEQWASSGAPSAFSTDQRVRIALLVSIDINLHAFYGLQAENAVTHVRRPHTDPDGDGTALEAMLAGPGYLGIARVLAHIEALIDSA